MTDEIRVTMDLDYEAWTGDEMHAYFAAVGCNPLVAAAGIDDALNADLRALVVACMGDDGEPPEELTPPPGWQPMNLLGIDPNRVLGFAWIPARRENEELTFKAFSREIRSGDLMAAFVESVTAMLPEPETAPPAEDAAPLDESSRPQKKTSPHSRTKSSRPTSSSSRSGKSAQSGTTSSKR